MTQSQPSLHFNPIRIAIGADKWRSGLPVSFYLKVQLGDCVILVHANTEALSKEPGGGT